LKNRLFRAGFKIEIGGIKTESLPVLSHPDLVLRGEDSVMHSPVLGGEDQ
jgi:hypothetical protein